MKIDRTGNATLRNRYFGIGMEKLDRDAFDPNGLYDKIAALGVKWIRLQSGWAKTEKKKGEYDFLWLDEIVENLIKRDLTPWICLCYGNPLYNERAKKIFGGVGCPPLSPESAEAWKRYCAEVAKRYRGKAEWFEVWNEPEGLWDGKCEPSAYTAFCKETTKAVKVGNPEAKIIVGSVASIDPTFLTACIECGIGDGASALSYHAYTYDERTFASLNAYYANACREKGLNVHIIHGESGSQSRNGGNGAFKGFSTDPEKQAKHLLRQMVTDRLSGAYFSSYFTATDMHENLLAKAGKPVKQHGYFGLLSAKFDKNGIACAPFEPKLSYYALQNVCAFFTEEAKMTTMPFWIEKKRDDKSKGLVRAIKKLFSKKIGGYWQDKRADRLFTACVEQNNEKTFVYWESTDLLNRKHFSSTMKVTFFETGKPCLVDLLTGEISDVQHEKQGERIICKLPVKDYPLAVVFKK